MENSPTINSNEEEIEVDIRAQSLQKELSAKYSEDFIKLLQRLAYEISIIGLPINEACMFVGIDHEKLVVMMQTDPLIARLIQTKDLEYKRELMKTVSLKAKTDDKMSQWLLQARYPDEFNPRKGAGRGGGDDGTDLLGVAVEFIQKSGDNAPIVSQKSGKAFLIRQSSSNMPEGSTSRKDMLKRISEILK